MLRINIELSPEGWNEETEEFVEAESLTIDLEHSLVSLSEWESKWCKAFFSKQEKTVEETIDYIRCMTLTENVDPLVYARVTNEHIKKVNDYISAPMTATKIYEDKTSKSNSETVTSELIYYWMIALNIPFECRHWHLNRLLTLIKVCNIKNQPPKKMSKKATAAQYAELNAARRKQLNTKG